MKKQQIIGIIVLVLTMLLSACSDSTALSDTDMEYSSYHSISDDGAQIYAFNSIPTLVIESAESYIKENNLDSKELLFVSLNSPYTFSPQYVIENGLEVYNPDPLTDEYVSDTKDSLFYFEEVYKPDKIDGYIGVGYFAVNKDGIVVDSNMLKAAEQLSQYEIGSEIDSPLIIKARELLGLDTDVNIKPEKCKSFFYDNSGEVVYCEKYHFSNGSEIYLNGVTGEKIK